MKKTAPARATKWGALPFDAALGDALGSRLKVHPHDTAAYAICGVRPKVVVSPRTLDEVRTAVRIVAGERGSLIVRGAGTKSDMPPAPSSPDAVLEMSGYAGVLDHEPADLTFSARAGSRFADLQAHLAASGQWLPFDPPFAATATLGGMLSADTSGALRLRYGTARDSVIGMRVVTADGEAPFAGSKVVKSVAGFDSHKLFIGARGTLGVVCDVSMKVAPLPAVSGGVWARFADVDGACAAALALARSPLFPLGLAVMSARAAERVRSLTAPAAGWVLAIRFGGSASTVHRQESDAAQICKSAGAVVATRLEAIALEAAWPDIAELAGGAHYPAREWIVVKLACLPTRVAALVAAIGAAAPGAEFCLHAASGIAFVALPVAAEATGPPDLRTLWGAAHAADAHALVLSAPSDMGADVLAPVSPGAPVAHQRRLKSALDPEGVFDPDRFVRGVSIAVEDR